MSVTSRGFTLLEVMIAMAILVMALAALLGHEGIAIQMSDYSNRLGQATMLAQGKLLDVETRLLEEGMDAIDSCDSGDFGREGLKQFRWKACGYKLEMQEGAGEQITQRFMELLSGSGFGEGLGGGNAPASQPSGSGDKPSAQDMVAGQLGMAMGALPIFLQQLETQVRKVQLEVSWEDAVGPRKVVLERFVTELGSPPSDARDLSEGENVPEALKP